MATMATEEAVSTAPAAGENEDRVALTEDAATSRTARAAEAVYRRRWLILALNFSIIVIYFIDRQTMSMLAPVLRTVFHLTNGAYGKIVAALQFGMMAGEVPVGWLMDRWGARLGLSAAVLWWSTATGTQFFAGSGLQLGFIRFFMGSAEGGNYSGGMKTVSRLFTDKERTLAIGIFNSGSVVGPIVGPLLTVFLLQHYGFRAALLAPAILGFMWVPLWWITQKGEGARGLQTSQSSIPLRQLLTQSSTWAVMLCRLLIGPVMQFYWYWTPSYLNSARHMSLLQIGLIGWIPYLLATIGGLSAGWAANWFQSHGLDLHTTRRITMWCSSLVCVTSLAVPWMGSAFSALVMISIAVVANTFLSVNMFAAITDLFPPTLVGRVTGLTGLSGGLSGFLFPLLTGVMVDRFSYAPAFACVAFMPVLGTAALFICGRRYRHLAHGAMSIEY